MCHQHIGHDPRHSASDSRALVLRSLLGLIKLDVNTAQHPQGYSLESPVQVTPPCCSKTFFLLNALITSLIDHSHGSFSSHIFCFVGTITVET